jgi:uncharacterized protein YdaU (DUF1376 family)
MKLTGLMWWIDRWRTSAAYSELTLEQQAAYRNLLDEATLRGGPIPNNERLLAKASGDATRWPRLRADVLKRFTLGPDGWRNATLDEVLTATAKYSAERERWRQKKARQRAGHAGGQQGGQPGGHRPGQSPLSVSVSVRDQTPLPPFEKGGRLSRADLQASTKPAHPSAIPRSFVSAFPSWVSSQQST